MQVSELKEYWHRPNHLFLDNKLYFITAAIHEKRRLLADPSLKILVSELIRKYFEKYKWELHHWVILDNHYHLIGKSRVGRDMSRIIQGIHGCSAGTIRKATSCGLPVWWNYWDYCPRNGREYLIRVNYLLNNPVKHGYVRKLTEYPFSSFHDIHSRMGREALAGQFREHPEYKDIVLPEKEDDF